MANKPLCFLMAIASLVTSPLGAYSQTLVGSDDKSKVTSHFPCGTSCITFRSLGFTRIAFDIKPSTPLKNLLPRAPLRPSPQPPWLVKGLTEVPEIFFQAPLPVRRRNLESLETEAEFAAEAELHKQELRAAQEHMALTLAKINHVNKDDAERFLTMLVENRSDLAGLPFLKGSACRMSIEVSQEFIERAFSSSTAPEVTLHEDERSEARALARVAAWMQTSPQDENKRSFIVKVLAQIPHRAANVALGKVAVFAPEKSLRDEALTILKDRPRQDYTSVLLDGLRYPWPTVANNAAESIVQLKRTDLVSRIVDFLDERDPCAPFDQFMAGRRVPVVRELVRLNHHHNCITCHAPATSDPDFKRCGSSSDFVTGSVTIPNADSPSGGGYFLPTTIPELAVRLDVTYLRQDFSLMQKVENGLTGAEAERYDFLVRTREMTDCDLILYRDWRNSQGSNYMSPNHQAALTALRQLTGRDAGVTAAAWRKVLK
jgi:hypothetical protein